jgi:hypothetical protein
MLSKDHFRFDTLLSGFGFEDHDNSVLWNVPTELLVAWAQSNPTALSRFLGVTALFYSDKENVYHWHPTTLALFANGLSEEAKLAVRVNLYSHGWSGSRVPYIERRVRLLHTLDNHPQPSVREMAREFIAAFEADKARELKSDAEEAAGIY